MPRRVPLVVAACLALAACGAPRGTRTLDRQRDLVGSTTRSEHLTSRTKQELDLVVRACPGLERVVSEQVPDAWTTSGVRDLQCQWVFGFPGPAGQQPQLVIGIIDGGAFRFHETAKLLDHERRVGGVGDHALYDPQSRALFATRNGRLWYVQLVGAWPSKYRPQEITTAIGRALLREPATR